MIIRCTCQDAFQDARYGVHRRVYTEPGNKGPASAKCRCTSCGAIATYAEAQKR